MQPSAVFSVFRVFAMTNQFCELDGKILSGAKSIYSHNKLHLNDEHECSICTKSFATLEYLMKHHKNVHSEATYNCNECEESFKLKKNLKRHIENVHLRFPKQDNLKRPEEFCKKKQEKRENKDCENEMKDFFESNNGAYQNKFKEFASKEICHHCSLCFVFPKVKGGEKNMTFLKITSLLKTSL